MCVSVDCVSVWTANVDCASVRTVRQCGLCVSVDCQCALCVSMYCASVCTVCQCGLPMWTVRQCALCVSVDCASVWTVCQCGLPMWTVCQCGLCVSVDCASVWTASVHCVSVWTVYQYVLCVSVHCASVWTASVHCVLVCTVCQCGLPVCTVCQCGLPVCSVCQCGLPVWTASVDCVSVCTVRQCGLCVSVDCASVCTVCHYALFVNVDCASSRSSDSGDSRLPIIRREEASPDETYDENFNDNAVYCSEQSMLSTEMLAYEDEENKQLTPMEQGDRKENAKAWQSPTRAFLCPKALGRRSSFHLECLKRQRSHATDVSQNTALPLHLVHHQALAVAGLSPLLRRSHSPTLFSRLCSTPPATPCTEGHSHQRVPTLRLEGTSSHEKLNSSLPSVNCGSWFADNANGNPQRVRPVSLSVPSQCRDSALQSHGSACSLVEAVTKQEIADACDMTIEEMENAADNILNGNSQPSPNGNLLPFITCRDQGARGQQSGLEEEEQGEQRDCGVAEEGLKDDMVCDSSL
ncbi:Voltage-dependent L-type calcium channel subunit alpha-1C [Acipenser ruthenus]|uniref:Voltage-dependent L-type calcium channel subunit alpha-1C n=1 Tax=Acipenser ruthenus TaxID=7906 RepID=A0A662YWK8_ACIRT|nr:Voltage-dependent L-type calcium channel subunit alpha-1C [Acipenser ruthenus]